MNLETFLNDDKVQSRGVTTSKIYNEGKTYNIKIGSGMATYTVLVDNVTGDPYRFSYSDPNGGVNYNNLDELLYAINNGSHSVGKSKANPPHWRL